MSLFLIVVVKSRKVFNEIDEDFWFVTRINFDSIYEKIKSFKLQENLTVGNLVIKSDDLVYLFDKRHNKSNPFRLVQTEDTKGKGYMVPYQS